MFHINFLESNNIITTSGGRRSKSKVSEVNLIIDPTELDVSGIIYFPGGIFYFNFH
jgi:hypothetical protein